MSFAFGRVSPARLFYSITMTFLRADGVVWRFGLPLEGLGLLLGSDALIDPIRTNVKGIDPWHRARDGGGAGGCGVSIDRNRGVPSR